MYISWVPCQVGSSYCIVLRPYVHILGPMSGGKVPEYSTGSFVYIPGPMLFGKVQQYSTGFLCIYPGPYVRWEVPRV